MKVKKEENKVVFDNNGDVIWADKFDGVKDPHCHFDENQNIILDKIWDSPKVNYQGHWYVRLTDVARIIEQ